MCFRLTWYVFRVDMNFCSMFTKNVSCLNDYHVNMMSHHVPQRRIFLMSTKLNNKYITQWAPCPIQVAPNPPLSSSGISAFQNWERSGVAVSWPLVHNRSLRPIIELTTLNLLSGNKTHQTADAGFQLRAALRQRHQRQQSEELGSSCREASTLDHLALPRSEAMTEHMPGIQ